MCVIAQGGKPGPDPNKKKDVLLEGFECGGHFMQAAVHAAKHAVGFVDAVGIAFSSSYAGENLDPFLDPGDGKYLELAITSSRSIKSSIFSAGIMTPCRPVNPFTRQTS